MKTFLRIISLMFLWTGVIRTQTFIENPIDVSPSSCGVRVPNVFPTDSSTYPGEFPWIALLGYENEKGSIDYACSGSLISARYVLTAAICTSTESISPRTLAHVRLGDYDIDKDVDSYRIPGSEKTITTKFVDVQIDDTITHPEHDLTSFNINDIALVRLSSTLQFQDYDGFISPICLPYPEDVPEELLKNAQVSGWELSAGSFQPDSVLKKQSVHVEEVSVCRGLYKDYEPGKQICMAPDDRWGGCVGISGSPLSVADKTGTIILGIVSYSAFPCASSPTVYTSVIYYREWILQNLRP